MRREGELAIRAALGASTGALRRTLLAESLLLCGAGAALGVLSARPMVAILARYASRFSVRALDLTVDSSMLWVGGGAGGGRGGAAGVCSAAAVGGQHRRDSAWRAAACASPASTARRQRVFAVTQIAASFVLLAGASMLLKTLLALQAAQTGFDTRHVLAMNVPVMSYGKTPEQIAGLLQGNDTAHRTSCRAWTRRGRHVVPWRDAGSFGPGFEFSADGHVRAAGRRRSARAVPHGIAGIFRGARCSAHRRPRFQRCGPQGQRSRW